MNTSFRKLAYLLAMMLWAGLFAGQASAQLFDDIVLKPAPDDKVVATIKLNSVVQYLRHYPQSKGQTLEIYYSVLVRGSSPSALPDNEVLNSPPSDLIPGFTVMAQDQSTLTPRLLIRFSRPMEYSVRLGKNSRSFDIIIQKPSAAPDVLDMGEIKVNSAQGEPLDAEIELFSANKVDKNSLVARLASPAFFNSMGVKYPEGLPKLDFQIATRADGEPYIKITSSEPVAVSQATLLVQLKAPANLLVREYTLQLPHAAPLPTQTAQPQPVPEMIPAPATATPSGVLDLGEIKIYSALGKPLDAEIGLQSADKAAFSRLSARLASPAFFKTMGVKYPNKLPRLDFQIATRTNGEPYIKVTSAEPVKIPHAKLLVQLNGSADMLVREYDLSPPTQAALAALKPAPLPEKAKTVARKTTAPAVITQAAAPTPQAVPVAPPQVTAATEIAAPANSVAAPSTPESAPLAEPATPLAHQPSAAEIVQPTEPIEEINKQAESLLEKGRTALQQGDHGIAIDAFNKLLMLPPNKFSQDAQELVGVAREQGGQLFKAKLEYELYLKTYTSGDGVARVKERLAKLSAPAQQALAAAPANRPPAQINREFQTLRYGSASMYYYHGSSQTQILPAIGSVAPPTNLSRTDQSLLLGNVTANLRVYNDEYDNRLAFQDTYAKNYLPVTFGTNANANKLNVLYYDLKNRISNYSARMGRQSSSGGGVMGRFDGATANYGFAPQWHINATAGRLVEYTDNSKPVFYGAGMDGALADQRWGGALYAINQKLDGLTDRRAVGGEVRYFDSDKTANLLLDYDTYFNAVNIASLQGTLNTNNMETSYNFLLDHRKSPSLSIRNALNGATVTSINALLQNGWTVMDIHDLAKLRTATTNQAQFGVTHKLRENWQIGGNASVAQTSGLPSSGTLLADGTVGIEGFMVATPPTGLTRTFSGQLVGSNIFSKHDVTVFSLSLTKSPLVDGQTYFISNRAVLHEKWTVDSGLRLYWQKDNTGGKEDILTPTLKLSYQAGDRLTLEGEAGYEIINNTPGGGALTRTTRKFFSLGGHSDF